jgi:serine/threonine protein kinase
MVGIVLSDCEFPSGDYELIDCLGEGSYGVVDLYWKKGIGFRAVKTYKPDVFAGDVGLLNTRFWREVEILASLRHPATTRIYAAGFPGGTGDCLPFEPWIEMEYIPAGTLSMLLAMRLGPGQSPAAPATKSPPLTTTESLIILYGIAHVLERLHSQNSVHRDVKSLNVFLDKDGEPHLGDFGFARTAAPFMSGNAYTLTHAAPEVLSSELDPVPYGFAADVWAFGMLIFEVRTGLWPFVMSVQPRPDATKIHEFIRCGENLPTLSEGDPFDSLYRGCIEMDPAKRQTMAYCVAWLSDAALTDRLGRIDRDRFDAYRRKLADPWKDPEPPTLEIIEALAERGSLTSNYTLAVLYLKGFLVPQSFIVSAKCARAAAIGWWKPAIQLIRSILADGLANEEYEGELDDWTQRWIAINECADAVGWGPQLRISWSSPGRGQW